MPDKINLLPTRPADTAATPLNDCARLIRNAAFSGSPKTVMYGFAAVSYNAEPLNMIKRAVRKNG